MGLFPQQFIDDLRLQAEHPAGRSGVRAAEAGWRLRTRGTARFTTRRRRRSTSIREKGFFHCFGCGVGGDVFKFLELHEKVGFQDAVRMLAQKFGIALPQLADGEDEARARFGAARRAAEGARNRRRLLQGAAGRPDRRARASAADRPRRHSGNGWPARARLRAQFARRTQTAVAETGVRAGRITAGRSARAARER